MAEAVTLEQIESMAAQLPAEQQLKLISRIGDRLSESVSVQSAESPTATRTYRDVLAARPCADKESLRQAFAGMFRHLNIEDVQPIGAEMVQALMRAEGVKPEDNLSSAGIIAMREE